MNYKEIYDELEYALWGENHSGGLLIDLYDPFHNYKGNLECEDTLEAMRLCRKFLDKLYADTKDENIAHILNLICCFVGEAYTHGNIEKVFGTKYDPEYMFASFDPSTSKEPEKDPPYELHIKYVDKDYEGNDMVNEETIEFKNYARAKKCMSSESCDFLSSLIDLKYKSEDIKTEIEKDDEIKIVCGDKIAHFKINKK